MPRFRHVAVTSVFGHPRSARTWSGAPANVSAALERRGVRIEAIAPHIGTVAKVRVALLDMLAGRGRPISTEQILRNTAARRVLAAQVAEEARRLGVDHVLHTGTFDLPPVDDGRDTRHYLYCDHTWALARRHHVEADRYTKAAIRAFDDVERRAMTDLAHVFTFGAYVRDHIVQHYGLPPDRVTAVGSGAGAIAAYHGPKDYTQPRLLFVAKHLFRAKGGVLLLQAFDLARQRRPDLALTIVGDERSRRFVPPMRGVEFHAHLPWEELERLYREATLLVQPMLNDPWGQVYLEAMSSRTPVMGLARNGLPELTDNGRHGFLVDRAEPGPLADAIVNAVSDPPRLERMADAAQRHVLGAYSWDRVAERMLFT
ncbi:MAG: glycosyltransferase family 4 protein [Proteobacteria bacterium]|nr:glycosyltransferase family 4 protein [Pseudomonadota bacterium]